MVRSLVGSMPIFDIVFRPSNSQIITQLKSMISNTGDSPLEAHAKCLIPLDRQTHPGQ
jgi:hypothetical protein